MKACLVAILFMLSVSCSSQPDEFTPTYVDLKGFFEAETNKLSAGNTTVSKLVSRNGTSQQKASIQPDWNQELSLFSESDINKPAWRSSYQVIQNGKETIYAAIDPNLRTRQIRIIRNSSNAIAGIRISNRSQNYLYNSSEELVYVPNHAYAILKRQSVVVLGSNSYIIRGLLNSQSPIK